jgi:hypothetical protein
MSPPKFSTALRHDSVEPLQICRTPHKIPETFHHEKKTQRKSLNQKKKFIWLYVYIYIDPYVLYVSKAIYKEEEETQ